MLIESLLMEQLRLKVLALLLHVIYPMFPTFKLKSTKIITLFIYTSLLKWAFKSKKIYNYILLIDALRA